MRQKRLTATAVALSMCAFLLGLSAARDALPGDQFQFIRSAPGLAITIPVADLTTAKKPGGPPDANTSAQQPFALAGDAGGLDHRLVATLPPAIPVTVHSVRSAGAPGCRGPPSA